MKAVMLSIHPKWCELIANGKKTVEVRKTRPKTEVPFKCYIYCTKPTYPHEDFIYANINTGEDKAFAFYGGGEVIGEFVCDYIFNYWCGYAGNYGDDCLSYEEQLCYLGENVMGYGWHISDLKIYRKPRELSEFKKYNRTCYYDHLGLATPKCKDCKECNFTRPPQSWCYVEELR